MCVFLCVPKSRKFPAITFVSAAIFLAIKVFRNSHLIKQIQRKKLQINQRFDQELKPNCLPSCQPLYYNIFSACMRLQLNPIHLLILKKIKSLCSCAHWQFSAIGPASQPLTFNILRRWFGRNYAIVFVRDISPILIIEL